MPRVAAQSTILKIMTMNRRDPCAALSAFTGPFRARLIQDYLEHKNIHHTVKYTTTNPARFEKLWR
jgi:hypothetical protein